MKNVKNNAQMWFRNVRQTLRPYNNKIITVRKRSASLVRRYPFATLFGLLGLLIVLIIAGNLLNQPEQTTENIQTPLKKVEIYYIGQSPRITVQAQVEKSGVVTITALSPGVVQQLFVEPGTIVSKGETLLTTSTNYQGGNAAALQRAVAARQLQNINQTYQPNKDLIQKQRELTETSNENDEELREITRQSLESTVGLIDFNDETLQLLEEQLESDEENIALRSSIASLRASNEQLRSSLRNAEYTTGEENPPAELSDIQKEITLKQLEIQEKSLDLNRDVARLQLQIAQVQEATMYPSSPFNATVQRVFVKMGEAVQPGTPLVLLSQEIEEDPIVAIAYIPRDIALQVSYYEPSVLSIHDFEYTAYPSYVTRDAIQGTLYGVYYPIPDNYHRFVTENGYISVTIPVGFMDASSAAPYVPLDAIYQTEDRSYIFVAENNVAISKQIELGDITGRYVGVLSGLDAGDAVILNRNVTEGDRIEINK